MKKLILAAAVTSAFASTASFAQTNSFTGFYGQIATGYESNSPGKLSADAYYNKPSENIANEKVDSLSASSATPSGAPLILGLGYTFEVTPQFLLGIGADYSFITQSSNVKYDLVNEPGATLNGAKLSLSNRFNIFITPSWAIDKDKVLYAKVGYSQVSGKFTSVKSQTDSDGSTYSLVSENTGFTQGFSNPKGTYNGYILGLGYKQMIANGLYGYVEANYMDYGKVKYTSTAPTTGGGSISTTINKGLQSYTVLAGLGYRF